MRVSSSGRGTSSATPGAVDQAESAVGVHRGFERGDAFGHVGTHVPHREPVGERGAEVDTGDAAEQPVDGAHAQLLGRQLHHEGHDRVGAGIVDARGLALGAVVARGLEPVVAVGEHQPFGAHRVGDGRDPGRVGHPPQRVVVAVVVGGGGERRAALVGHRGIEEVGQATGQRESPDRVEVGAGRAQQLETVALGLREGALVGHHVAGRVVDAERADHAGGALRTPVVAGEVHPVDREGGRRRRSRESRRPASAPGCRRPPRSCRAG